MNTREVEIANAREVDEQLAEIWSKYYELKAQSNDYVKQVKAWRSYRPERSAMYQVKADEFLAKANVYRDEANALNAARYTGWTRFYLVKHVHRTDSCSSFRPTTRVGWLPDVSGLTEAEAVEIYGANLCSICFESAPVQK
jgi:hypothetical protein